MTEFFYTDLPPDVRRRIEVKTNGDIAVFVNKLVYLHENEEDRDD